MSLTAAYLLSKFFLKHSSGDYTPTAYEAMFPTTFSLSKRWFQTKKENCHKISIIRNCIIRLEFSVNSQNKTYQRKNTSFKGSALGKAGTIRCEWVIIRVMMIMMDIIWILAGRSSLIIFIFLTFTVFMWADKCVRLNRSYSFLPFLFIQAISMRHDI